MVFKESSKRFRGFITEPKVIALIIGTILYVVVMVVATLFYFNRDLILLSTIVYTIYYLYVTIVSYTRIIIIKRVKPIPFSGALIPIMSLVIGLLLSSIILSLARGISPVDLFFAVGRAFFQLTVIKDLVILTLVGISLVLAFTGAVWNIGSEGQIHMGMMVTTWIALFTALSSIPFLAKIVCVILAGVFGALWAAIAGLLRAYAGIDEVPITLMMNYIAYYILDILVYGPWKGEYTYGYIRTDEIPHGMWFQRVWIPGLPSLTATWEALLLAIVIGVLAWLLLKYTTIGLRIRVLGSNPDILRSSGISVPLTIVLALTISGFVSGVVGAVYVLGDTHRLGYPIEGQTANHGYLGILVAWLSMLDVRAVPVAAYIVSALRNAGLLVQIAGIGGTETMFVFIGSVLLTYSVVRILSEYSVKIRYR